MEPLQTNINENKITENQDYKNLKQNEMVHIAEDIHQENGIDSDLNEHYNENEEQNNGNEEQNNGNEEQNNGNVQENDENEQENDENEQANDKNEQENDKNEQVNDKIDQETDENHQKKSENDVRRNSGDKNSINTDDLPLEVKIEEDDAIDSYSDGSHVFRKYRFRQRDIKPDYTKTEIPHIPMKKRIRYEPQDSFDCDQCPQSFDSRHGLLNHKRKHIARKNIKFTCSLCSEEFIKNDELIEHKKIHKDMMFTCEKCQIAFTDHCEYLEHEITHTLRSTYKCIECGLYYNKTAIQLHFRYHFDRRIKCEICQVMIKKGNFNNHVANHKLVKCVECDKLIRPDTMSYHMIRHTGFKPYQCLYCGKGFSNSAQRNVHTRIHTDERPFECDICNQKFKQTTDLKRHKQTHFDKKFQCNVCLKKFIHKESLATHITIHSNTQRYKCEICNTALSTSAGYKSHMLHKHSNDKVYSCNFCGTNHKTKVSLNRHNRTMKHMRNANKNLFIKD